MGSRLKANWDRIKLKYGNKNNAMTDQPINADSQNTAVLDPVTAAEFFDNYWETQPLHIARDSTNPFEHLISIGEIEDLLSTNELFYPSVQLSHAGQIIPAAEYTDERNKIVSGRVVERYHRGSTIVLTHLHKLHKELMSLCRDMQRRFMMRCQTNVYLSPTGNQGFNPHFDTHDVFILQVSGSKTFNFYSDGSQFPTSADSFNSEIHQIGSLTESIELSAGDTLYIPRGFTHDAIASNHAPSLHVTLGVYPILVHELLQELVHIGIAKDVALRKSIAQSLWMSTDSTSESIEHSESVEQFRDILHEHINDDAVCLALSRLRDGVALETSKNCLDSLQNTKNQPFLDSDIVCVKHEAILQLERSGNTVKLRTFGEVLEFNEPLGSSVEWLVNQPKFKVADIPELDGNQRSALLEKLREHDLIVL